MKDILTLGDLVKLTGVSVGTLQQFIDLGILKPNESTRKKGRGMLREFPAPAPLYGELAFLLIAAALKKWKLPFADIKELIDKFRVDVDCFKENSRISVALKHHIFSVVVYVDDNSTYQFADTPIVLDEPALSHSDYENEKDYRPAFLTFNTELALKESVLILNLSKTLSKLRE